MRTPLAWKNLTYDLRRLALAVAGVGFAVLLMCMELSFREALFDSTLALIRKLDAQLIITSAAKYTIIVREPFARRRLFQALGCEGVEAADGLEIETQLSLLKNLDTGEDQPIRVLAFDPDDHVLNIEAVERRIDQLRLPDTALFDRKSKSSYGVAPPYDEPLELAGRRIKVVGDFELGTDFANDGNMIVSDLNYHRLFPERDAGEDGMAEVDIGVVKTKSGADVDATRERLRRQLPDDVTIFTKQEFEDQERRFWQTATPIGYIFWLGTMMGFVVGIVICYQILYADIADHMAEFATLKAMGYGNAYFIGLVLQEAVILSLLGFVPGVAVSELLCRFVAGMTGLLVRVSEPTLLSVLVLSLGMCIASGCLAMRKLMSADPAELF
ncbi:MAG TPA: ABC transporter permease DevC [Pirellulales bacterium]|nr:ABC transporter permease DevC [Pirellulales bacterium]